MQRKWVVSQPVAAALGVLAILALPLYVLVLSLARGRGVAKFAEIVTTALSLISTMPFSWAFGALCLACVGYAAYSIRSRSIVHLALAMILCPVCFAATAYFAYVMAFSSH